MKRHVRMSFFSSVRSVFNTYITVTNHSSVRHFDCNHYIIFRMISRQARDDKERNRSDTIKPFTIESLKVLLSSPPKRRQHFTRGLGVLGGSRLPC